jgi:D-xylose transport system ATP-binding protein
VAICRSVLWDPKVVLLDEPTAALGVAQREQVLNLIGRLRDQGRGVILVSHDLADVLQIADRVLVLRLGSLVAEFRRGHYTREQCVAAITGMGVAS